MPPFPMLALCLIAAMALASPVPTIEFNQPTTTSRLRRGDTSSVLSATVYRTRAQSAVNLGFWLVGERYGLEWHYNECNADPSHNDELVLARHCTKEQKENFWDSFITEWDFAIMAEMGINTARLPIGYWTVGRENCRCENTPFWEHMDKYANQWSYVMKAIDWAAKYNIGILLDVHGAEGSQNGWEHSGDDSQPATFLDNPEYQEHATQILEWIAWQIKDKANVIGLELLNEPNPDDHSRIDAWYDSSLVRLRSILGDDFPFYISGSINDQTRVDWIKQQSGFVVLDYHMYSVFDGKYQDKEAQEQVGMMWGEYDVAFNNVANINVIVGEWSCINPNPKYWGTANEGSTAYCDAEMQILTKWSIAGMHYWSWKVQQTDDWLSEWSFLSSTKGVDGLSKIGTGDRALLTPANGQKNFWPDGTSIGIHEKWNRKRDAYASEAPDAIHIWEEGCNVARTFAEAGTRLGFKREWIRREKLSSENHTEEEYYRHFTRGVAECES